SWIVIIDGIDHVVRAGLHAQSLFDALPQQLPGNIVFVVFGQPGWNYPKWLERMPSYYVPPLDKDEIKAVLAAALGWDPTIDGIDPIADQLLDRTAGNPLSLFYNVQLVAAVGGTASVAARLPDIELVGADPRAYYESLAERLSANLPPHLATRVTLTADLLQFCAIALTSIDAPRLVRAFEDDEVKLRDASDALAGLRPILVETSPGNYRVFHDDFRRFGEQRFSGDATGNHARHVVALAESWQPDELAAFAEHLWLAKRDTTLSELPFSKSLDEWLAASAPAAVATMHRLALAAALRVGDEALIARTALAVGRVAEVAPDPRDELWMLDRAPATAREWLFVLPPSEDGRRARGVRGAALNAACEALASDPDIAATLAARFLVMPTDTAEDDPEYSAAVVRWLLASGQLEVAFGAREQLGGSGVVFDRLEEHFERAQDLYIVELNARALAGTLPEWELLGIEGAVARIMAGDLTGASRIVQGMLGGWARLGAVSRRDVFVLTSLLGLGSPNTFEADGDKWWTFGHRGYGFQPEKLYRLFAVSYVAGRLGSLRDPDAFVLDDAIAKSIGQPLRIAAEWICRAGEMVGLFQRNPALVRPAQLASLFRVQAARLNSADDPMQRTRARYALQSYAPLVALVVRTSAKHAEALAKVLFDIARTELADTEWSAASLAEALWLLDEGDWRQLAHQAAELDSLPRTAVADRERWYDYWVTRGGERGIAAVERLAVRRVRARLGVARKTQPESIALTALERLEWSDARDRVRDLLDLLIREDGEPEGGRYFYHDLPELFARVLRHDPAMFAEEIERFAAHTRVQLGGKLPSLVVKVFLEHQVGNLAVDDALAMWFWVAAAPGSFGDGGEGEAVGEKLAGIVEESAPAVAADIARWISLARRKRGIPKEQHGQSDDESTSRANGPAVRELSIDDVRPHWFSSWHADREHKFLMGHLEQDPTRFAAVCRRLAERVHDGEWRAYELVVLASAMLSVRASADLQKMLTVGLEDLAARVASQPEPPPRGEAREVSSLQSALWRLVADGVQASDVDSIQAAVRALGVAAAIPGMCRDVEKQAVRLLKCEDDLAVEAGLAILRRVDNRSEAASETLQRLLTHANACVRAGAAYLVGAAPEWPVAEAVLVSPALDPGMRARADHHDAGRAFYSSPTQVLTRYSEHFADLIGGEPPEHRASIDRILEGLPLLAKKHIRSGVEGPRRSGHRVADAAARYATSILAKHPCDVHPVAIALTASFDAWQLASHPDVPPPTGWLRLGTSEHGRDARRNWVEYHMLVLMSPEIARKAPPEKLGPRAMHLLEPKIPQHYPWVSNGHSSPVRPPMMSAAGALVFRARPFTSIQNASFDVVPRWDAAAFQALEYRAAPRPGWYTATGIPAVVAVMQFENLHNGKSRSGVAHSRHWSGWYYDPMWLADALIGGRELLLREVRVRRESTADDSVEDESKVIMSYDVLPVTLPELAMGGGA
ncbi:MAG: hypothetical protein H6716_29315, partial [Polyangiaceae bacterium]|nr:hypothetical protein [Polyangiaceae bacterium]